MPESKDPPASSRSTSPVYVNYFSRHYDELRFPLKYDGQPGLRRGQIGALHAIAAHFTFKADPAVVTMPTGSGKTVVLALSPYILRANRVLAITPSRLVRNQIPEEFEKLGTRADLRDLQESVTHKRVLFEIVIVQPGISRARLQPDNIALPLASADLFIREGGAFENLRVWGSA